MNIGIATFSNALSYGAVLQAFALKSCLEEMGHNAFVIDAQCKGNIKFKDFESFYSHASKGRKSLRRMAKLSLYKFVQKKHLQKKIADFENFRNNRLYCPQKISENCEGLDLIICGSDQIWNPTITGNFFDLFFGINEKSIPAISYAGSIGDLSFVKGTDKEKDFLAKMANFKSVSCREDDVNEYLNSNEIESTVVIDPSLLLTKEKYLSLLGIDEKKSAEKYVFVYNLNQPKALKDLSSKLAKDLKCDRVTLNGTDIPLLTSKRVLGNCSVEDFVRYINNAECVVTDSFHGVAFSIILKKKFYVILPQKRSQRLVALLKKLNLSDRIIKDMGSVEYTDIDYSDVYTRLDELKNTSIEYLREHIK